MVSRCLIICVVAAAVFAAGRPDSAEAVAMSRRAVTSTGWRTTPRQDFRGNPILSRPNRPGHFIGNAIRRGYGRRAYGR